MAVIWLDFSWYAEWVVDSDIGCAVLVNKIVTIRYIVLRLVGGMLLVLCIL